MNCCSLDISQQNSMKVSKLFHDYKYYLQSVSVVKNKGSGHYFCTHMEEDMESNEFFEYLDSLKNYEKSGIPKGAGTDSNLGFDMSRMKNLMNRLGNPQSRIKVVHVAGTKGKGSTASFLSNILRAEGYAVGCYTSPHIKTVRERISLGNHDRPVSGMLLNRTFKQIKHVFDELQCLENGCLTHFEVLTAMAFTLFAEQNMDIAVMEAGLGGARDATNVTYSSDVIASIITSIDKEHLDALGGSLESIAEAKSGIIKKGCPLVIGGKFVPHIEEILRRRAASMGSPVVSASHSCTTSLLKSCDTSGEIPLQHCDLVVKTDGDPTTRRVVELRDMRLRMLGPHQLQNATTATCAALCVHDRGWPVSDGSIRAGLENTHMPGRVQFLSSRDAASVGLHHLSVLLDGAHTVQSVKALMETISIVHPGSGVVFVVAMAADKDHLGFASEILSGRRVEAVILTEVDIAGSRERTMSSSRLVEQWVKASAELGVAATVCSTLESVESRSAVGPTLLVSDPDLRSSLTSAGRVFGRPARGPRLLVVTGSFHLVSSLFSLLPTT